jgi:hypothetical protein
MILDDMLELPFRELNKFLLRIINVEIIAGVVVLIIRMLI